MSQVDYDLLVIGDDPSAFWLMRELSRLSSGKARLGWISLAENRALVPVPRPIAEKFTLHITSQWNLEIASPRGPFTWCDAEISRRFKNFPVRSIAEDFLAGKKTVRESAAKALQAHPDILGIAESVWRAFHYSETATPETLVIGLALASEWGWWDSEKELPKGTVTICESNGQLESVRSLKGGGFSVKLKGESPLSTKRCVLATSRATALANEKAFEFQGSRDSIASLPRTRLSRFPLTFTAKKNAVPWCLAPWNILMDAAEIPDVETEVTPLEVSPQADGQTQLRAWLTGESEGSPDNRHAREKTVRDRLNGFFPFLNLPAESETSSAAGIELYTTSLLEPRTRDRGFYVLGPFHRCHLPYPYGALTGARFILKEVLAQEKRRFEKQKSPEAHP